jgi:malonyl CoA-acyl carrier protein transacylase
LGLESPSERVGGLREAAFITRVTLLVGHSQGILGAI